MTIEIIKEYKSCWQVGMIKEVQDHFGLMLIEDGYAKRLEKPPRHKMIEKPEMAK